VGGEGGCRVDWEKLSMMCGDLNAQRLGLKLSKQPLFLQYPFSGAKLLNYRIFGFNLEREK
jgi:hypothetical protein